jgi:multiple sugar transport system substrate-binding protein
MNMNKYAKFGAGILTVAGIAGLVSISQAQAPIKLRLVEVITAEPRTVVLNDILKDFKAANPGIEVELISLPWAESYQKLLNLVQSGQAPDVAEISENWLGLYGSLGALENLDPYLKNFKDAKDFNKPTLSFGKAYKNTMYFLPYGFYVRGMFYNKVMFKDAGLKTAPRTFDDFAKFAAKVSKSGSNRYGYCLRGSRGSFDSVFSFMSGFMGSADWFDKDGKSTFDSPGAIKGIQYMADLYKSGGAPKASVNWGFNEIVSGFASSNCAMLDQDPDALLGIRDQLGAANFDVAPMPVGPNGKAFVKYGTAGWSMFSSGKNKEAAWKLTQFLIAKKNNLKWANFIGILPIYKGADKDAAYSDSVFKGWFTEVNNTNRYVPVQYPLYLPQLGEFFSTIALNGYQQVLLGQKTAEQAAKEWAAFLTKANQDYLKANPTK